MGAPKHLARLLHDQVNLPFIRLETGLDASASGLSVTKSLFGP
jgi:hypothetical protein